MFHRAGWRAVGCHVALTALQLLFFVVVYVWVHDHEAQVVEVCHALRMRESAGVEAAATIVLPGALCECRRLILLRR
jgi:hypothetical protein